MHTVSVSKNLPVQLSHHVVVILLLNCIASLSWYISDLTFVYKKRTLNDDDDDNNDDDWDYA